MKEQLPFEFGTPRPRARRAQRIHENSRAAHNTELPGISSRAMTIAALLRSRGGQWTDRQIKDELRLPDMNSVRPRITELIDLGLLREAGKAKDPITNKTVRLVEYAKKERA